MAEFGDAAARRCTPVAVWPDPDRAAWATAHRRGALLDEDGLAVSWAPATSSIIAGGYGRYLSFLAQIGDLDPDASPASRVDRARVHAYVTHLRELNHSSTVAGRILQLVRAMAVMAPTADLVWLRRILAGLRRMAHPARDDRTRLVPAIVVRDLGVRLMQRAEANRKLSVRRQALLFRDGLMISILTACPVRARNVAAMSIGTSLHRRGLEWWVAFGQGETKNGRPIEMPLPSAFTGSIEKYIAQYRPHLARRSPMPVAGEAFWISDGGRPLTAKEVGQRVSAITKRELGQELNPHLFRKMVATELAIRDPAHVGIAQALLGHADPAMTQCAYNLGRALDAAGRHHALVRSIRAGSAATEHGQMRIGTNKRSTGQASDSIGMLRRSSGRNIP